ncbi:mannose-6-phosphate isomerase [Verticillium alfalfae VaMs.102]|uniref:Mannose-6-phosphate isomerase n=1 Tax=Verticillium alfalfae (strain VaMs.102 / ATCC MYA-4576 / FGSC 10136) TaxID=526221 RepID=C9STY5_VERA1|nr:mannose-6-phosphate isomerase [Verticillium alfalfae VaMs.102]EEY22296.1 mannose-6-phosphate isomerase [Verticillium alfalfae VaMs.102]
MPSTDRIFQLSGTCNNYDWGKKGRDSLAARLCANTPNTDFEIDGDQHYSEMWFGDYPDFPVRVLSTGELLADVLQKNNMTLLGDKVNKELNRQLPYLPKILSINKALPLQMHPNKELAAKLHKEDPQKFTDPNHKPEIAIALSDFEVFAGWKPTKLIAPLFNIPALRAFIPNATSPWTQSTLREATRAILLANDDKVVAAQDALAQLSRDDLGENKYILDLLPRLKRDFGAQDPGILVAVVCMNFMKLKAGEALFIPADGIHAYLSGDIVECMARSNNVLNTGFCPKGDRDNIDLFSDALTFAVHRPSDAVLPAKRSERGTNRKTLLYRPPLREFDMLLTNLQETDEEVISKGQGPGVAIVTKGEGVLEGDGQGFDVKEGFIFFIAPEVEVKWRSKGGLQVFTTVV